MEASELRERPAGTAVGASAELLEFDPEAIVARSPWQLFWRRFKEDKLALASLVFIVFLVLVAIFAPLVVSLAGAPGPNTPDTGRARSRLRDADGPIQRSLLRRRPARP